MIDYQERTIADLNKRLMEAYRQIGSFVSVMEMARDDLHWNAPQAALRRLCNTIDAYNTERDAVLVRLGLPPRTRPVPTMVNEIAYEDKHSDVGEDTDAPTSEDAS